MCKKPPVMFSAVSGWCGTFNTARKLVKTRQEDLFGSFMSGFLLELRRILSKAVQFHGLEADPDVL
jgi:hypothetical protein